MLNREKTGLLVEVLLDEVGVLREMVEELQGDNERKEHLLAEKAEIIKHLSSLTRNKVTPAKKRKAGRPKGSKNSGKKG